MSEQKLSLTEILAAQAQGRFFGPQPPEAYDKPTNIVVAGNGIFRVVKTPVALFKVKTGDIPAASKIPGLADMDEVPELLIPKIPLKYLTMVLTFYRDVHAKDGTEASALFFWNHNNENLPTKYSDDTDVKGLIEDGQLIVYCPQQKNSGTLSEFGEDGMVNYLREHCTPLCETHSHHTMDAFWSGTDDANENMTQFYGVWGKIKDEQPKFLFRWVCGGKRVNLDASILFDIPQIETKTITTTKVIKTIPGQEPTETEEVKEVVVSESFKGPWERVEAPDDWMPQHRKSWGGTTGGYNYNKGKTGGATPSGGYGYATGYGYGYDDDLYDGYETGISSYGKSGGGRRYQDKDDIVAANAKAQGLGGSKKNEGKDKGKSSEERTEVEIFLEKNLGDDTKSISQVEDTVREIVNELIDLGYDYVVSDTMTENSGYGHLHGTFLNRDWY
jgi:hypothetical protein